MSAAFWTKRSTPATLQSPHRTGPGWRDDSSSKLREALKQYCQSKLRGIRIRPIIAGLCLIHRKHLISLTTQAIQVCLQILMTTISLDHTIFPLLLCRCSLRGLRRDLRSCLTSVEPITSGNEISTSHNCSDRNSHQEDHYCELIFTYFSPFFTC
jgi:hypothetical protein